MSSVDLRKSELLSLLDLNNFVVNEYLINEVLKLVENEGNVKLQDSISDSLTEDIRSKMSILCATWKRLSDEEREIFRKNAKNRDYRIKINPYDVLPGTFKDYLNGKYESLQSMLEISNKQIEILENEKIILKEQIEIFKDQLSQKEAELSLSAKKLALLQKEMQTVVKTEVNTMKKEPESVKPLSESPKGGIVIVQQNPILSPQQQNMSSPQQQPKGLIVVPNPGINKFECNKQNQSNMFIIQQPPSNTNVIPNQMQQFNQQSLQSLFAMQNSNQSQMKQPNFVFVQAPGNQQQQIIMPTMMNQSFCPQPQQQQQQPQKTKYIITHVVTPPKPAETTSKNNKGTKRNIDEIYVDNRPELGLKKTVESLEPNPPLVEDPHWERKKLREKMEQFKHLIDVRKIGSHNKDEKEKEMIRQKRNKRFKTNLHHKRRTETSLNAIKFYHDSCTATKLKYKSSIQTMIKEFMDQKIAPIGLCISCVVMLPLRMRKNEIKLDVRDTDEVEPEVDPSVDKLLYHKDKFTMSDRAYQSLKTKCDLNIPSINMIRNRRAQIDLMFEIHSNSKGVFVTAESKIRHRVEAFFERKYSTKNPFVKDNRNFKDEIIHIRLAADGTNIGRCLKLLNFTFTILNEGPRSLTANGNYTLGIYEMENENYENLLICFKEHVDELSNLKEIKIGDNTFGIVFYYSGDWKMLAHSLGIQSANSKYPCVWCKCCKDDFADKSLEWSITDPAKGARSHEDLIKVVQLPNNSKTVKYGYDKLPLFKDIIPINRYMIDMLHLFLRISDTLINLLVKDCTLFDKFESWTITRFDVTEFKHLHAFQKFLNEKCKVSFKFVWLSETKKLTWRDLVGPEKIRFFEAFDLKEIFPEHDKLESLQKLWTDFYDIINGVKRVKLAHDEVKTRTQEWLDLFLTIYNKTTVTPYVHAFVAHLHEFVFLYKDINAFNLQGLEKLNDLTTGQYFKGTNKSDSALTQILKKRNRMEFLRLFIDDAEMDTEMG